jgi:hypothetical protein
MKGGGGTPEGAPPLSYRFQLFQSRISRITSTIATVKAAIVPAGSDTEVAPFPQEAGA